MKMTPEEEAIEARRQANIAQGMRDSEVLSAVLGLLLLGGVVYAAIVLPWWATVGIVGFVFFRP